MFSQICHKFPGLHESCVILLCAKNIVSALILSVMFFYNTLSVYTTANNNSFYMVKRIKQ